MPIIYNVTIESEGKENFFHVTWQNMEKNTQDCFTQAAEITTEEIPWLWQSPLIRDSPAGNCRCFVSRDQTRSPGG